jgi:hypothetical protein
MGFGILAISIFSHKYNPFSSISVKKQTNYFIFFEVPTHVSFFEIFPFWEKKVTVLLKFFPSQFHFFQNVNTSGLLSINLAVTKCVPNQQVRTNSFHLGLWKQSQVPCSKIVINKTTNVWFKIINYDFLCELSYTWIYKIWYGTFYKSPRWYKNHTLCVYLFVYFLHTVLKKELWTNTYLEICRISPTRTTLVHKKWAPHKNFPQEHFSVWYLLHVSIAVLSLTLRFWMMFYTWHISQ